MRKLVNISLITVLLVVAMTGAGCDNPDTPSNSKSPETGVVEQGCEWSETLPESRPSDFNLLFKYGYGTVNKNELNTFNGTYTKAITVEFRLTDEDMERIYQKMVEIEFFCYPDEFVIPVPDGEIVSGVSNHLQYYFRVECDNKVKIVQWKDNILNKYEDADKLRWLAGLIIDLIESKDEYWDLPSRKGIII